jgi:VanZ family protein
MIFFALNESRAAAWLLAAAIIAVSTVPPWLRPETGLPRNLEHFTIFFVTGLAFGFGYRDNPVRTAMMLAFFAGVIEIIQIFMPGRHARLSDFIVDACAPCVGVIIVSLVRGRPRGHIDDRNFRVLIRIMRRLVRCIRAFINACRYGSADEFD